MNRKQRRATEALTRGMSADELFDARYAVASRIDYGPLKADELRISEAAVRENENSDWFQGGTPGRPIGDLILPSAITGADPRKHRDLLPDRDRHAYIATSARIAQNFADTVEGGVVYRVQPLGDITADPVILRTYLLSLQRFPVRDRRFAKEEIAGQIEHFCCPRARVLEVL